MPGSFNVNSKILSDFWPHMTLEAFSQAAV